MTEKDLELQKIIKPKIQMKKRIMWNSFELKDYFIYAQKRTKELKLKSVAEYCIYLTHNGNIPNRVCKCGKIKSFKTTKLYYADFCSKKCIIKYTKQKNNENELIKYIISKNNNIDYTSSFMSSYKDFITEQSKNFESKSEYITYLFHNKSLPNSICRCGKKKPYQFPKTPYNAYCSRKCANKYCMTKDRRQNLSIKSKENYNNYSDEKKQLMIYKQNKSFKENWSYEDSKRYSNIMKERYKNYNYWYKNKIKFSTYSPEKQISIIKKGLQKISISIHKCK